MVSDVQGILRNIIARYPLDRLIQPLRDLIQLFAMHLDEGELREICTRLEVAYDDLPGETLSCKARRLVRRMERQDRIPKLIACVELLRPDVDWDKTANPRKEIGKELESELKARAAKHGAKILKVDLHNIELKDQVVQQWIETWQARWQKLADEELAEGKAEREFQLNRTKAVAQEMLLAIQEALETPGVDDSAFSDEVLAVRLIETLRNVAAHPRAFPSVADPSKAAVLWNVITDLIAPLDSSTEPTGNETPDKESS
jgi:regulator of protease activity HflC (stomatin/prohibitin superfamily)